jgi:hypothetical protein
MRKIFAVLIALLALDSILAQQQVTREVEEQDGLRMERITIEEGDSKIEALYSNGELLLLRKYIKQVTYLPPLYRATEEETKQIEELRRATPTEVVVLPTETKQEITRLASWPAREMTLEEKLEDFIKKNSHLVGTYYYNKNAWTRKSEEFAKRFKEFDYWNNVYFQIHGSYKWAPQKW